MRCSLFALSQPISLHRIREVIESAPPLKVSEEREINSSGLKKKLLKRGQGWESWDTPELGDEITGNIVPLILPLSVPLSVSCLKLCLIL
ncbi:hypothetical protein Acr_04g0002950 [Actinidia rufa]|uniref:Uncharacterized protein n=1 Tax=Actinidia rufa TaxID=165716 RepID=A0A7J0EIV1_9ERIC|nr:hypothetical protein Acr_04g0002950 [Actinidia rufa]